MVPVLFLNTSLGTPLLPNTIESQDFEKALAKAEDKSLLTKWYSLDTHAQPPCYRLSPPARYIPGLKVQYSSMQCAMHSRLPCLHCSHDACFLFFPFPCRGTARRVARGR